MDDTAFRIMQLGAQGLCCSQILMKLALDDMGEENAPLVRAMAGLCNGLGIGGICGAAAGGACVIALYAARGDSEEEEDDTYQLMLDEFMDWFTRTGTGQWGGASCELIMGGGKNMEMGLCGEIIIAARNRILDILTGHGFDPSMAKEQRHA